MAKRKASTPKAVRELPEGGTPRADVRMGFQPGNRFWEARSTAGRDPIFTNPDHLWGFCVEYFKWVHDNPLHEAQAFAYQGRVAIEAMPKMRAMSIGAMCLFLDIARNTWNNYRELPDFLIVTSRAEEVIRQQKFEGASADLLNPNIIARDLGLSDKSELTGAGGGPIRSDVDVSIAWEVHYPKPEPNAGD
jgi:hypothetical protein